MHAIISLLRPLSRTLEESFAVVAMDGFCALDQASRAPRSDKPNPGSLAMRPLHAGSPTGLHTVQLGQGDSS